jgi:hypothetical protein
MNDKYLDAQEEFTSANTTLANNTNLTVNPNNSNDMSTYHDANESPVNETTLNNDNDDEEEESDLKRFERTSQSSSSKKNRNLNGDNDSNEISNLISEFRQMNSNS